jgi:membrane peptidoglycan carboxypeptidase
VIPLKPLDDSPQQAGGWHLPGGTTPPPAQAETLLILPGEGEAVAEESILPHETGEAEAVAEPEALTALPFEGEAPADEAAAPAVEGESDVLPFEAGSTLPEVSEKAAVEETELGSDAGDLDLEDEDDDDRVGMSELIALQSLANAPAAPAAGVSVGVAAETPPAQEDVSSLDPAEYARRELERLRSRAASGDGEQIDAAEYARRELELLKTAGMGVSGATPVPADTLTPSPTGAMPATGAAPAPLALTPEQQALAEKYRQSEERARALKSQYAAGLITRETLEAELKKLMVLEDGRIWWMIGAQSDQWYKYENNTWVAQRPSALELEERIRSGGAAPTSGGLPYMDQPAAPAQRTSPTAPLDPFTQPLPRPTPVRDPDLTQIASGAAYLGDLEATVPIDPNRTVQGAGIDPTLVNPAIAGTGVPSPAVASDVPAIPGAYTPGTYAPDAGAVGVEGAADESLYRQARERQQANTARTAAIAAALIIGAMFLLGACGAIFGVVTYNNLADPWRSAIAGLASYQPQFQTARILAADNSVIATLNSRSGGARTTVDLRQIAPELIHAVVSIENPRFFLDPGFDPVAIAGAIATNVTGGELETDTQTITQQIARRLVLGDTSDAGERRLQEIVIAAEIARTYDKEFILELYLNEIFFGNQSFGVEAASEFYFEKSALDLTLPEAALLAGLIESPSLYDPVTNREVSFDRMDAVLNTMAQVGCLPIPGQNQDFCVTAQQVASGQVAVDKADVETRDYLPRQQQERYPHFVRYIQTIVERDFGSDEMFRRGFSIRTTLVPRVQDTAEAALRLQLGTLVNNGVNNGAVLVTNATDGAIMAMVGSADFNNAAIEGSQNNVFVWNSPGSAITPIIYTAGIEGVQQADTTRRWYTPASILWDVPTIFNTTPQFTPTNFDGLFRGAVSVRTALGNSYNVPAVKALSFVGIDRFRETSERMGLTFTQDAQFSLRTAQGATDVRLYDMVNAFGTLANNGVRSQPYAILSITDANGNAVTIPQRPAPAQAVQPGIAYLMQHMLADVEARRPTFDPNNGMVIPEYPGQIAVKTGISEGNRDLWTIGFARNTVVGVWLGRFDSSPTFNTTSLAAVPVWNQVMRSALNGRAPQPFANPGGVATADICTLTGARHDPNVSRACGSVRQELFLDVQPPPNPDQSFVVSRSVDTWSGLLANASCPNFQEARTFISIDDPSALAWLQTPDGFATAQALGIDPRTIQALPTSECGASTAQPVVQFSSPADNTTVQGIITFGGTVTAVDFARYQIEAAPSNNPNAFTVIVPPQNVQQPNGQLGQFDTARLPNGSYRLRLAAFSTGNGYAYRYLNINIVNPTPTPQPTFTPLPPTLAPFTPIPFDTPIPFFGDPTPTATITFS